MAVTDPAACHGVWLPLLEPLLQRPVDYNREFWPVWRRVLKIGGFSRRVTATFQRDDPGPSETRTALESLICRSRCSQSRFAV